MNVINERPIMIFRNEVNGRVFYKAGLSKKDIQGNKVKGSIDVSFKKGTDIQNQTLIIIKNAWLDFWKDDKRITHPFIFINDYSIEQNQKVEDIKKELDKKTDKKDPFAEFGDNVSVDDDFLE